MSARTAPLQARIVKPEEASSLKAFGLDLKVLLTTEATGGAISVLMAWLKPGEGPSDHVHFSTELHAGKPFLGSSVVRSKIVGD